MTGMLNKNNEIKINYFQRLGWAETVHSQTVAMTLMLLAALVNVFVWMATLTTPQMKAAAVAYPVITLSLF